MADVVTLADRWGAEWEIWATRSDRGRVSSHARSRNGRRQVLKAATAQELEKLLAGEG
jgi:hypothetical protein